MYVAQQMGELIATLVAHHTTDALEMAPRMQLVLTRPGQGMLQIEEQRRGLCWRIAYLLYTADGRPAPEPEIWFWTGGGAWIPYAIRRSISGYAAYAEVSPDGRALLITDITGQGALALHADWLATHLRSGKWLAATDSSWFTAAPSHPSALQRWVAAVAQKHDLDLTDLEAYVQLTMPERADCLVIQRVGPYVSVARYLVGDDRFTPDPEVLVRMHTHEAWLPTEVIYSWDDWQAFVAWAQQRHYPLADVPRDILYAYFADYWAETLHVQGWLEHGQAQSLPPAFSPWPPDKQDESPVD